MVVTVSVVRMEVNSHAAVSLPTLVNFAKQVRCIVPLLVILIL